MVENQTPRGREADDEPTQPTPPRRRRVRRRHSQPHRRSGNDPASARNVGREVEDELRSAWDEVRREFFGHAARQSRPSAKRQSPSAGPSETEAPLPLAIAAIGVAVARAVVWVLFGVAAPLLLTLLAMVLGKPMQRAKRSARDLGQRIDDHLARVERDVAKPQGRHRVSVPHGGSRVRVETTPETDTDSADPPPPHRAARHREL
jgi:hypothetical protein